MGESPTVPFDGEQRALLNALVQHWKEDAHTAEHCANLCTDQEDKAKLTRRQKLFEQCSRELSGVLDTGCLPPRVAHRAVGLDL